MTCFYVCRVHAHLNAGKGTIVSLEDLYKQMVTLVNIGAGTDPEAKCVKQGGKSMREEPVSEPGGRESDRKRRRDRQRETKEGQKWLREKTRYNGSSCVRAAFSTPQQSGAGRKLL